MSVFRITSVCAPEGVNDVLHIKANDPCEAINILHREDGTSLVEHFDYFKIEVVELWT